MFSDEFYNQIYLIYSTGGGKIEAVSKLNISFKDYNKALESDSELQRVIELASKDYCDSQHVVRDNNDIITREEVLSAIKIKINEGKFSLKDIVQIWNVLFPDDDYSRAKAYVDMKTSEMNAQTNRMKVEQSDDNNQTIADEFINMLSKMGEQ